MYRMICIHLAKAIHLLRHLRFNGDLTTGAFSSSIFPKFILMKHIRFCVNELPNLKYDFRDFVHIASIHVEETHLYPPPVYKSTPLRKHENRIRSIGEIGYQNKVSNYKNHFTLGNRFTFQSEKVKIMYYSDKSIKYFSGLMKSGYFYINWIGH